MMKIAIIGFGTVGSGVAEVFYKNRAAIEKKAGQPLDIKYIVDIKSLEGTAFADKWEKDFNVVLADSEVGVVVETIGGIKPAYDFSLKSLKAGKHVVTSNKELVATHGAELIKTAHENNVNYLFEASVGGGIPVLHPLYQCLGAGDVTEVAGILNGTTNFIMTKMIEENMSFDDALKMAQSLGYAEQNPAADVEGKDACRKICILASLAYGKHVYPEEVHTEGITEIKPEDVHAAQSFGYAVKLIGRVKKTAKGLIAMVSPALVPLKSPLGNIHDVYNGILVRGSDLGDVMFYGRGAGKAPTASAVLSDVIDAVGKGGTIENLYWEDAPKNTIIDYKNDVCCVMIRAEKSAVEKLKSMFGCQKEIDGAFISNPVSAGEAESLIKKAQQDGTAPLSCLRVLDY